MNPAQSSFGIWHKSDILLDISYIRHVPFIVTFYTGLYQESQLILNKKNKVCRLWLNKRMQTF